jgi:hypothetical protein
VGLGGQGQRSDKESGIWRCCDIKYRDHVKDFDYAFSFWGRAVRISTGFMSMAYISRRPNGEDCRCRLVKAHDHVFTSMDLKTQCENKPVSVIALRENMA